MEFRPQQYDYHRKKPTFYQGVKRQRLTLLVLIVLPICVLALIICITLFFHH